jgi:hypothetical protein
MQRQRQPGDRRSGLRFLLASAAFSAACTLLTSTPAHATSIFRFENRRENVGAWRIVPEFYSESTTENYDATGAKAAVPNLTSYKKTQLDLTVIYGLTSKLSLFGRLSMDSVSFAQTSFTGSGSGLSEQGLGGNYRIWEKANAPGERPKSIDFQVTADIPLYDNTSSRASSPRQPIRGDGSFDFTHAVFGTLPLNQGLGQRLYLIGGLGYAIRGSGYSSAIPYQLQFVGLPEKNGILYRAGFHGFKSMASDANGVTALSPQSQTSPGVVSSQDAGGSFIADALNSSYLQFRATLGYQWGVGDQIFATYLMPMSGTSTAAIKGIILGAQFRFPASRESTTASATPTARGAAKPAGKLAYDLQGHVKQANDRLNLIKIDKGESDGVEKGQVFDIYRTGSDGLAADLVARGVVTGVSANEAVVNLRQYKKEVWVQTGFIARRIAPKK